LWLHSLKVAQLLRSAACLHTNQSRSYLNHLVPLCLYPYSQSRHHNETKHKYSSWCVLCFHKYTSIFHTVSPLFDTMLPALNKFFEPVTLEFFRLFLKPFSCSRWHCFITWEINSFEILLESCKPEVRLCQILAVGRV